MTVKAILWEQDSAKDGGVRCLACSHYCRVGREESGRCRMRVNRAGTLYSLSSDRIAAANLDPVEKKPLFHFMPGTLTFSLGTPGCNMTCAFCQNHSLSQGAIPAFGPATDSLPDSFAAKIVSSAVSSGASSVSFTYNEPTISPELITTLAPRAREAGLDAILVSNAYAGKESMAVMRDMIRAANFDLKSFSDSFYRDVCGARLAPALRTIALAASFGWWVEVTTLLIPGRNDSDEELKAMAAFIRNDLGPDAPWHISRFRPMFRLTDAPPTPLSSLERAVAIGRAEGLRFVYAGNVPGHDSENTRCPGCGDIFIRRKGYEAEPPVSDRCAGCGARVPGVWRRA